MRDFTCGFTTAEINYLKANGSCDASRIAVESYDNFMDIGSTTSMDVFMEALVSWRQSDDYPFARYDRGVR
jgi:hypothetical protein